MSPFRTELGSTPKALPWLPDPRQMPEIECEIEDLINVSWSFYEKRNITSPKNNKYQAGCTYYDYRYDLLSDFSYEQAEDELTEISKSEILPCKHINIMSDIPNEVSYIKEFDLMCQMKCLHFLNFFMEISIIVFGFPAGVFADIYGRRPVHIYSAIILCITGFLIPFSTNFVLYALCKCIQGGCLYSICIMLNLIYTETCRRRYRVGTTMIAYMWFAIGSNMPSGFFYIIEVWRLRNVALAFTCLICLYGAVMCAPESPRHLMVKRQFSSAWDCLEELGCTAARPNLLNVPMRANRFNYQMRILTKPYLQKRLFRVLMLKGAAVYFYCMFRNTTMNAVIFNDKLKFKILAIEVVLLICTSLITLTYTKKAMICIYFVLIALCITTNMIVHADTAVSVSILAGMVFAAIVYIINITYIIDIFPTTHRGTIFGFVISFTGIIATIAEMYHEELPMRCYHLVWCHSVCASHGSSRAIDNSMDYLSAFYCGLCMICALIAITSPNSNAEIPDKNYDLNQNLTSLDDTVVSSGSL